MKKFTFMLLAAFIAVAAMADGPQKRLSTVQEAPFLKQIRLGQKASIKQAPKELAGKIQSSRARSPKKAVAAADLVGDYTWSYQTANESSTDLENLEKTEGSSRVSIALSTTTDGGITISGMFPNSLEATLVSDEDGDYFQIAAGQVAGTSSYGDYVLNGLFFYEGDEESAGGWYFSDIYGYIQEDGTISIQPWLARVLTGGQYDGYNLTPYWVEGSTLTPADPLSVVVAPEGLETEEYSVTARNYKDDSDVSGSVYIGFDGSDVYIQGLSTYLPDAWVKGTLDGTTITFPYGQYLGNYGGSYDMYLNTLVSADVVFNYDAEAGTLTAQNEFFLIDNSQFYFDSYRSAVFKKAVEKAVMPANPAIASLENGDYGWYLNFNVPTVDVNGDGLITSKLYYMIYTDVEGEIAPLTFTPATHAKLTENMTEIPYGFTENYDFYNGQIFLNDLYSATWNSLGIQSIYYGGGETNATEIQWFKIKDYSGPTEATFNFNAMDVPTSSGVTTDGDINEAKTLTESGVTLAISPKDDSATTPNRFWSTKNGPQLRVYSGTLTFTVPEGSVITKIDFSNNGKWNEGNSADSGEFEGAVWTGEAQTVIVTIAGNTQINSITVTVEAGEGGGEEEEDELVVLPEGVEPIEYTLTASGATSQGNISIEETKNVAFDGTDVYLQGLAYYFPEAYVKGTLTEENQVIVPTGQFVGEDDYGVEYLVAIGVDEQNNFTNEENIVFNLDTETGVLTLEGYYGESGTKDASSLWDYFESAVYTPGALVLPDLVELPEGVEAQAWTLEGVYSDGNGNYQDKQIATEVAFNGNDVYVKGLPIYFPEAWVKGTIDAETGIATFEGSQFVGKDDYGMEFMIGFDGENTCDFQFAYDAEAKTLTQVTPYILESPTETGLNEEGEIKAWGFWTLATLYEGEPIVVEPVTAPAELATETFLFKANELVETEDEDEQLPGAISFTKNIRKAYELKEYTYQTQVGFDGNDVYFKGFSDNTAELWAKGTLSEDGMTVTIPANQYIGKLEIESVFGSYEFPYYITAADATSGQFADLVLNYDAQTQTFSTSQTMVINGSKFMSYPYQTFTDVTITKLEEFAATPADPTIEELKIEGTSLPNASFIIPATDVDGNDLLASKLFYTVWIEKDGQIQPFTVTAADYRDVEEDMVEIPYNYEDNYDIYKGGSRFYFNPSDEPATWTKLGVQSIYYGGGECNKSNIVWAETGTGIDALRQDEKNAVIYNIAGQRVQKAQKGLYIVNGKKVVIK